MEIRESPDPSETSSANSSTTATNSDDQETSSNPSRSSNDVETSEDLEADESLASLANLVENHVRPHYNEYDDFVTSYIASTIPSVNRILCDETGSYTADLPPFKNVVRVRDFALQEKRRKEIGESTMKGKIIPTSKTVLKEIKNCNLNIKDKDNRRSYFFFKAKQWCEVTKALAVDAKYPRASPAVIRDKYSDEHRKALKLSRKAQGLKDSTRMFDTKTRVSPFPIPLELLEGEMNLELPGYQAMAKVVQEEESGQAEVRAALSTLLGEIEPIAELQLTSEEPWQYKARKTTCLKSKPVIKASWKRTEYPPKSKDEKIADLRKLLPEPKAEDLQTDYLSGIWEPELMTESFSISGLNYDSRISEMAERYTQSAQVDWWIVHDAKEKCKNWLLASPD